MWKEIALHIASEEESSAFGKTVQSLAAAHGAALKAVVTSPLPAPPYGPGAAAIFDIYNEFCRELAAKAQETARRAASEFGAKTVVLTPHADRVALECASQFRSCDLLAMRAPAPDAKFADEQVFDAALFQSGRPTLVIPRSAPAAIGRDIAIAWKDCREAARAVHDAMPLLLHAERVRLIAVHGAEDDRFFGQAAMDRMLALLGSHGVPATATSTPAGKDGAGATLLREAQGADTIVMGAYGRWRMAEKLFGGMTKHVLEHASVPILMSH